MMCQAGRILLIDDNAQRQHDAKVILDFLGEGALVFSHQQWRQQIQTLLASNEIASNDELLCVLVGKSEQKTLSAVLDDLRDWDAKIPVITFDTDEEEARILKENCRNWIARLEFPPTYTQFLDTLHRAQIYRDSNRDNVERKQRREAQLFRSLVGTSRTIIKVRELMAQVADKDVNVLITGESGTGKEVVARNLHYHSHRRHKPFVPVNCGAIPAELLESELFGHEKGAFTGAVSSRAGRFELAQGGTLFLDEIGDMPLHMQVKILRVLQERTYERVGSTKTLTADVRIIAATHRNLEESIKTGSFREDLYYRLNVFPIEMPALRERTEDIPLLINELIARIENEKRGSIRFNSAAIMTLCRHPWSGNVRELANLVERLVITHPYGIVGVNDLPRRFHNVEDQEDALVVSSTPGYAENLVVSGLVGLDQPALLPVNGLDLKDYLSNLECSLIQQALDDCNGVVARAAEKLKIRRTTLVEKMRKYDAFNSKSSA